MNLTSFWFILGFMISVILYYLLPRKHQWIYLLIFSISFFLLSSARKTVIYLLLSAGMTYIATTRIEKSDSESIRKMWMVIGVVGNAVFLSSLKYSSFVIGIVNSISGVLLSFPVVIEIPGWAAPIGISFYTLSAIGYIVDCYLRVTSPSKNFLKDLLFICYWPVLTSGPILKHSIISEDLYAEHEINIDNICFGIQRLLWGIIKKIVISARLGTIVDAVYRDTSSYNGTYIWIAAAFWVLQLYTDFSGCMDIIIGASECYGIILPENFNKPFFAKNIQEFWQRWHITLGTWYREYILYPILNTKWMTKIERTIKKKYGRKTGRVISSCLGMLFVWLLFGLWHGGDWKYVIMGLYFWTFITFETITNEWFEKLWIKIGVPTKTIGWKCLQCLKVFIIVTIGYMFFRVYNIKYIFETWKLAFNYNPWVLFDGSIYELGLSELSYDIMVIGLLALLMVSLYQRKHNVRKLIAKQPLLIRWTIYLLLIFVPMVFGVYGPGYDAQAFIYKGF